jgi:anti-anti-sigma factor
VTLPEHIDVSNAGRIREELLSVINRGPAVLIADMSATISCDHAGADAVARAYRRAVVSGTQLRLVVTAPIVRRVLGIEGLDRLVSIYPSVAAAVAAGVPETSAGAGAGRPVPPARPAWRRARGEHRVGSLGNGPRAAAGVTPAVLLQVIDALADGVALTDDDGQIVLVNRRMAEMFGYSQAELIGLPVESLVPAELRAAHRDHRAAYEREPTARPMGERARLVGLRRDTSTFPVQVSLSPVPTATGHLVLAVVRDATETKRREDLADFARAAVAEQTHRGQELLDRIVGSLFHVGVSLQAAVDLPSDVARERIAEAVRRLDDTIREIRDHAFRTRNDGGPRDPRDPRDPG